MHQLHVQLIVQLHDPGMDRMNLQNVVLIGDSVFVLIGVVLDECHGAQLQLESESKAESIQEPNQLEAVGSRKNTNSESVLSCGLN